MKPPSSTQPPTATKSQPKNIVTSWSARGDSTKKQQDQHLSAAPTLPPKSASKRPAGPPAEEQQPEEAVETIPNIVPDGSEALDVVEELQQQDERGCTGGRPLKLERADRYRQDASRRVCSINCCIILYSPIVDDGCRGCWARNSIARKPLGMWGTLSTLHQPICFASEGYRPWPCN